MAERTPTRTEASRRGGASVGGRDGWLGVAAAALALAGAGCKPLPPQMVLRISTDMDQGQLGELREMVVKICFADAPPGAPLRLDRHFPVGPEPDHVALPVDLVGISPRDNNPAREVIVEVRAKRGGVELFTRRAIASFEAERIGLLEIFLPARCLVAANRVCPAGEGCGRTGCEPERVPLPLPPYHPLDAAVTDAR